MPSLLAGPGNIYRTQFVYAVNGVPCQNNYHHYPLLPGFNSQVVNQLVLANVIVYQLGVMSAYITPIYLRTTLVTSGTNDIFTHFFENESGAIASIPADPRLAIYCVFQTAKAPSANYQGGLFLGGVPLAWATQAPELMEIGRAKVKEFLDLQVALFGSDGTNPNLRMVIFSRVMFEGHPAEPDFWSQPVDFAGVRKWLVTRRTRRPRQLI